jgi:hypothetical protein
MRWSVATIILVGVRVAAGCGGETDTHDAGTDATTMDDAHHEGDASSVDGFDDVTPLDAAAEKEWPIVYNTVDGGGDSPSCYPDGDIVQACCNGQPCRGFCVGDEDGAIECNCYGIPDGCTGENAVNHIPNVCCSTVRGCVSASYCSPWSP